jgi:hypothetical protein
MTTDGRATLDRLGSRSFRGRGLHHHRSELQNGRRLANRRHEQHRSRCRRASLPCARSGAGAISQAAPLNAAALEAAMGLDCHGADRRGDTEEVVAVSRAKAFGTSEVGDPAVRGLRRPRNGRKNMSDLPGGVSSRNETSWSAQDVLRLCLQGASSSRASRHSNSSVSQARLSLRQHPEAVRRVDG